jgi:hypothetical protein
VLRLEERLGFVHKGIEKIAEGRDPDSLARLAGRVSGDTTVAHAWARAPRFRRALEQAGLAPADVCKELGNYDCFNVHRIALGGVEPYTLGINEPFPDTAVTAPLAIERVALSGCRTRVDQDLAQPAQAQLYKGLTADTVDVRAPEARAVVDQLYARFQSRRPTAAEADALLALYADVTTAGEARPGRAWAILACFAVATSVESLFY